MKPFFKKKPVKEQMTPFKDLTFSEKVHYIWEYYKYFMLAAVLVIIAVVSFVISFQRNNYTTAFSMVIIDGKMTGYDTGTDAITTGFTRYLGIDGKKERVLLRNEPEGVGRVCFLLRNDRKSYRHQPQKQGEKSDFSAHINLNLLSLSSPKVINAIQRPKYYKNFFC